MFVSIRINICGNADRRDISRNKRSLDLSGKSAERRLRHAQARRRLHRRAHRPPVRGPLLARLARRKKHARNVYAHTGEECEEKPKELIVQVKKEIAREEKEGTPAKSKK